VKELRFPVGHFNHQYSEVKWERLHPRRISAWPPLALLQAEARFARTVMLRVRLVLEPIAMSPSLGRPCLDDGRSPMLMVPALISSRPRSSQAVDLPHRTAPTRTRLASLIPAQAVEALAPARIDLVHVLQHDSCH